MKQLDWLRPIHPFPARMAPAIVWTELKRLSTAPLRVCDPMAGSGTTLVVARKLGHTAVGFDADPFAVLLSQAWASHIDEELVRLRAQQVLERARQLWRRTDEKDAFPGGADIETKDFIRYWFDDRNRRELFALSKCIGRIQDEGARRILWCAFSRMIITKTSGVSLAMDVSHSRPHRVYDEAPVIPFKRFQKAVEQVLSRAPFKVGDQSNEKSGPEPECHLGDARNIQLEDESVDIVITSPPYANAIDYVRCHKFSLVWMGHEISTLRNIRGTNIGAEKILDETDEEHLKSALTGMGEVDSLEARIQGILRRFVRDMHNVLGETFRILKPDGRAKFVIGDCTMRGVFVSNSNAIFSLAKHHGLKYQSKSQRAIPDDRRYLPPPTSRGEGRGGMRQEVILTLTKPK